MTSTLLLNGFGIDVQIMLAYTLRWLFYVIYKHVCNNINCMIGIDVIMLQYNIFERTLITYTWLIIAKLKLAQKLAEDFFKKLWKN